MRILLHSLIVFVACAGLAFFLVRREYEAAFDTVACAVVGLAYREISRLRRAEARLEARLEKRHSLRVVTVTRDDDEPKGAT